MLIRSRFWPYARTHSFQMHASYLFPLSICTVVYIPNLKMAFYYPRERSSALENTNYNHKLRKLLGTSAVLPRKRKSSKRRSDGSPIGESAEYDRKRSEFSRADVLPKNGHRRKSNQNVGIDDNSGMTASDNIKENELSGGAGIDGLQSQGESKRDDHALSVKTSDGDAAPDDTVFGATGTSLTEGPIKRGRGRPRKHSSVPDMTTKSIANSPPLNSAALPQDDGFSLNTEKAKDHIAASQGPKMIQHVVSDGQARKRGRPRKISPPASDPLASDASTTRARGRHTSSMVCAANV